MIEPKRRRFLKRAAALLTSACLPRSALAAGTSGRVVVIGGGFAGTTCAGALKRLAPKLSVTLVETNRTFVACPFSNQVIAGLRELAEQSFTYDRLIAAGVTLRFDSATAIDPKIQAVTLSDGTRLAYDRLVLAPGVDFRWDALTGYSEAAAERMPHAWKAGPQTMLLRRQLEAMADGGVVAMSVPDNPYRCPPAPYERASLIAYYLKVKKPKSKLIVLDAKDTFSQQQQFQRAWTRLYPGLLEWVPLSSDGKVTGVDIGAMTLTTDFGSHKVDVANVIPPQKAGAIAALAGAIDRSGWCPIDPVTFASTLQPDIHVIGDAAITGALPKAGFAANAEGKACASVLATLLRGDTPASPTLANTCYALAAPDYGFSIKGTFRPAGGQFVEIDGSAYSSPLDAPAAAREEEARLADSWFQTVTHETFG